MLKRWSEETSLRFVQLYRYHENLWNTSHKDYRNREARNASIQNIVDVMLMDVQDFTVSDVPKKIKSLRSTYYLEVAKMRKSKARGGPIYKPSLLWFSVIEYIIKRANLEKKATAGDSVTHENEEEDDYIPEESYYATSPTFHTTSPTDHSTSPTFHITASPQNFITTSPTVEVAAEVGMKRPIHSDAEEETVAKRKFTIDRDEFHIFGEHVAATLRRLSSTSASVTKFEISKVLFAAEMGHYENGISSTPGDPLC